MEVELHSFLAFALDDGGWVMSRPGNLTPDKEPLYQFYRRLGGPQFWSGWTWERKNLLPALGLNPTGVLISP